MKKLMKPRFGFTALFIATLFWGLSDVVAQRVTGVVDADSSTAWHQPLRSAVYIVESSAITTGIQASGNTITQDITLNAGWNAIYLEVEPDNPAPLVNVGTAEDPIWVPEQPMIAALFSRINCENCVESVWSWNVPFSTKDYIVDPAEGLWDEPGWLRYFPAGSAGPDGGTRTFLTDLVTMHANTGYLVKMVADLATPVTLSVQGLSVVDSQQWVKDSYNLAGFPVLPGSSPTVSIFFDNTPITEARYLTSAGYWEKLTATDTLTNAQSYLVYYDGDVSAPDGFTAPLNVPEPITSEMPFAPGTGGQRQVIPIENTSSSPITVSISFANASDIPLYFENDSTIGLLTK
jgi:hypothetical protein